MWVGCFQRCNTLQRTTEPRACNKHQPRVRLPDQCCVPPASLCLCAQPWRTGPVSPLNPVPTASGSALPRASSTGGLARTLSRSSLQLSPLGGAASSGPGNGGLEGMQQQQQQQHPQAMQPQEPLGAAAVAAWQEQQQQQQQQQRESAQALHAEALRRQQREQQQLQDMARALRASAQQQQARTMPPQVRPPRRQDAAMAKCVPDRKGAIPQFGIWVHKCTTEALWASTTLCPPA